MQIIGTVIGSYSIVTAVVWWEEYRVAHGPFASTLIFQFRVRQTNQTYLMRKNHLSTLSLWILLVYLEDYLLFFP